MLLIASFSLLEPGPILGPEVPGDSFIIIIYYYYYYYYYHYYYKMKQDYKLHTVVYWSNCEKFFLLPSLQLFHDATFCIMLGCLISVVFFFLLCS